MTEGLSEREVARGRELHQWAANLAYLLGSTGDVDSWQRLRNALVRFAVDDLPALLTAYERGEKLREALRWYADHKGRHGNYDAELYGDLNEIARTPAEPVEEQ